MDLSRNKNRTSLLATYFDASRVHYPYVEKAQLMETLRRYLENRVTVDADGNATEFARRTGIRQSDVANALNQKKGRYVTWEMLVRIANTVGPALPDVLGDIAEELAKSEVVSSLYDANARPELVGRKLRRQLASAKKSKPASVEAEEHQPDKPPEPREPPEQGSDETTDQR